MAAPAAMQIQPPAVNAGHRLVHIVELLEQILLNFKQMEMRDMQTLLLSQCTCRAFRETILGSAALRRYLGFDLPDSETATMVLRGVPNPNPFIFTSINKAFRLGKESQLEVRWLYDGLPSSGRIQISFDLLSGKHIPDVARECENASWRRMHIFASESELRIVRVEGLIMGEKDGGILRGSLENSTLGELFDLIYY